MLMGAGFSRKLKKRKKLGKWVSGPIPKSGWPKKPVGMGKKAGWFWSKHKEKAQKVQAKAKSFIGKLWAKGKAAGSKVVGKAADLLAKHSDQILDAGMKVLSNHIDEASGHADKYLTEKIDSMGAKTLAVVKGKKKGGSMMLSGAGLPKHKRKAGSMMLYGAGLPKHKRKAGSMMLYGAGLSKGKQQRKVTDVGRAALGMTQKLK